MTLEEQIAAWPEQMQQALTRLAEARARFAQLSWQLEVLKPTLASMNKENDEDEDDGGPWLAKASPETERRHQEASQRVAQARLDRERARAEADTEIRDQAAVTGQKITEVAIKARITIHPKVDAAERAVLEAEREFGEASIQRDLEVQQLWSQRYQDISTDEDAGEEDDDVVEVAEQVAELDRQQAELYGEIERAKADVRYQQAVGQSLKMLVQLRRVG